MSGPYRSDDECPPMDRAMPLMTHDEIVAELEALRPELRRHAVDTARLSRTCDVPVPRWKA